MIKHENLNMTVDDDVMIARDGTPLAVTVFRPVVPAGEDVPVLLLRTPYGRFQDRYHRTAASLVRRGYMVVLQDIRGRWESGGEFKWIYAPAEEAFDSTDGYDTIEWCAALPGSDGRVGMFGHSYHAWAALMAAVETPPHLVGMFIGGMTARALDVTPGIFETGRRLNWVYKLAAGHRGETRPDMSDLPDKAAERWETEEGPKWESSLPLSEIPADVFGPLSPLLQRYLTQQHVQLWDFTSSVDAIQVPVALMTGWWDRVVGTAELYTWLSGSDQRRHIQGSDELLIGPWSHDPWGLNGELGDISLGDSADQSWPDLIADYFDRLLDRQDTKADIAPVRVFCLGRDDWLELDQWPPEATDTVYFLDRRDEAGVSVGSLERREPTTESSISFQYDPMDPVPSIATEDAQLAPLDMSSSLDRSDVVVYSSNPVSEPYTAVGEPVVRLSVQTDALDTDFMVKLLHRRAGSDLKLLLSHQAVRLSQLRRDGRLMPAEVGSLLELEVTLRPVAVDLELGDQLILTVSSSDFPNLDRNHNTGLDFWSDGTTRVANQTILHGGLSPSRLIVPTFDRP